jgi:hypothetical protein
MSQGGMKNLRLSTTKNGTPKTYWSAGARINSSAYASITMNTLKDKTPRGILMMR